ncbi:chromosome segregation and condensation protein, ScpB [Thermovibrio ammonificans HB-1]|uniref:Chromosome segregation and condensation protein, ScpB n=1 Tax=Thermovibrio ammonificans (strain DSM 15698 / JCM 12110 / HB-1) TaxID=648996 RepID=E8T229_THEA1|nr:SMC-Scp complex subunit ScpB [Thermovibrio ammonificans]ADU96924.1 chromosome segregation and condensation protein, ScpB [Thermovibrio ammonificans HB-1]
MERTKRLIEAALFLAQEPVSAGELSEKLNLPLLEVERALRELLSEYEGRGIVLREVAGGYRFFTAPDLAPAVKEFVKERPVKLSRHLLEVLAIIAYNQPITRKEIAQIRGQNPDGAIRSLLEKGLIEVAGRAKGPGRPKLYRTTKEFLYHFRLASLADLPEIELEQEVKGG